MPVSIWAFHPLAELMDETGRDKAHHSKRKRQIMRKNVNWKCLHYLIVSTVQQQWLMLAVVEPLGINCPNPSLIRRNIDLRGPFLQIQIAHTVKRDAKLIAHWFERTCLTWTFGLFVIHSPVGCPWQLTYIPAMTAVPNIPTQRCVQLALCTPTPVLPSLVDEYPFVESYICKHILGWDLHTEYIYTSLT